MNRLISLTEEDYLHKKFEIAKNLLPTMVGQQTESYVQDIRKRSSLIYNCVAISDHLMKELGYIVGGKKQVEETDVGNKTAIRKLSEMLKEE